MVVLNRVLLALCALLLVASALADGAMPATLQSWIDGGQRSPANRARDGDRHPLATLQFFGVQPGQTVLEIWPGGGAWWTEILAPYLHDGGHYIAALPLGGNAERSKGRQAFLQHLAAAPTVYDRVQIVDFSPDQTGIVAPDSVDMLLTFRNLHDWLADGQGAAAFQNFFRVLKPGGILGIEDHRARSDQPQDPLAKSGYVREDYTIALAEAAGFRLLGKSEVNANPRDTKDYPAGVWTLPPSYRLHEQDHDRYQAIGESDRFTLKFVKPIGQ